VIEHAEPAGQAAQHRNLLRREPGHHLRVLLVGGLPAQAHLQRILREYETHHRPHRSLHAAAPLQPLPEPVDLEQYHVRRQTRVGGLINEYRLVA
jgi:hypothetical protein